MQGEDTPVFLGRGLGLVPAVMSTIPCIIRTDSRSVARDATSNVTVPLLPSR